jgi:hypothetical protein
MPKEKIIVISKGIMEGGKCRMTPQQRPQALRGLVPLDRYLNRI